jgi:hypothetical protein
MKTEQRRGVMRLRRGMVGAVVIALGLGLVACTKASDEPAGAEPASVEAVPGSSLSRVTLSPAAARRLDVQTAPITELKGKGGGHPESVVPYAAVLYDPNGDTWVYTSTDPLSYVRAPISVDRITGSAAIVSSGPPVGTEVVTVGAPELLGVEYEVGEE